MHHLDSDPPDGIVFAFAGQASQYAGMGEWLAARNRMFSAEWRRIRARLWAGLPSGLDAGLPPSDVRRTYREIFAVQWALARTLMARGLQPDVVIGVSMGEICAAAVAQLLPEPDAVELVTTQAHHVHHDCQAGGMVAVMGSPGTALAGLAPEPLCEVGMISRRHFVLGGDQPGLRRIRRALDARQVASFMLPVDRGFHSGAIEPAAAELRAFGRFRAGSGITFASSFLGDVTSEPLQTGHMWSAVRGPIRFIEAARKLGRGRRLAWIDVGPGTSVSTMLSHNGVTTGQVQSLLGSRRAERLPGDEGSRPETGVASWVQRPR
jgi:trans-AT polyketide synthase/acyltransferase/oxidoreductase domain-containing protein